MPDNSIKVKAYGKILNFPAGTSPEAIESAVAEHEHLLNPEYERPSGAGGLLGNVVRGAKSTARLVSAGYDAFTDDRSGVEKTAATSNLAAERETPVEQQRLQAELHGIDREQGVMSQMGDTLKAAGRNPTGTGQLVAEQLPNSAVTLAGGYAGFKGGALAGAPFGPAGVAIGGTIGFLGGMFLGNTLIEAGSKGIQKASDKDGFTEQDKDDTIRESAIKGAVLTGVDAATLKLGSVVMKRLGSTAVREGAKAEAKVLMDSGVDMSSTTTINAALKSSPELFQAARLAGEKAAVGALSRSKKAGIIGTGLTMETAGEGIGEYAGEYAATGKADVVDATIEALSGATMSVAETAYNFNKLKAGNDLSAQGMMDSITPETLEGKRADAMQKADVINKQQQEQSMADIGAATDVDQAIAAATGAVTKPTANANDILRAEDPTLADIEKLTGLKPTHAIDAAIDEINNPINDQPLETENGNNQTAQQEATTKTPVLEQNAKVTEGGIGGTGAPERTTIEKPIVESPIQKTQDTSTKVEALTDASPVLNAETFKASDKTGTSHAEYLKSHPNRKQAAAIDAQNVESNLVKGLQKTGKFTATDSKTYAKPFAEFYKVNAERQGILPSELYERMPLKFNGKKSQRLSQEAKATPVSRNKVNFDLKDATPEDFTPDNVGSLLNKKNWAVVTAANPSGKAQGDASNAKANEKLQKELADKGLAFEVVKGRYPGDKTEMESYLVYGLDQKAANELGNKYGQDSVLTREGLVHQSGKVTPVKAVGKGKPDGYTKVPRTGARFAFDMDWDREASVTKGAMSLTATRYSKTARPAFEGKYFGNGLTANERYRLAESKDPRIKNRIDFYVDIGNGVTPEAGLGNIRDDVLLHNIYDGSTNPLRLKFPSDWLGANTFEAAVLDAGYDGYYTKQGNQGRVVMLGKAADRIEIRRGEDAQSGESELLSQSQGEDTSSRESDGSLQGLPRQVGQFNAALHKKAEKVAKAYMKSAGLDYNPPNTYANVNVERAERIATAFDTMKHDPQNPEVKAAYDALVKETTAQYKAVVDSGLKVEFIDFSKTGDPYAGNPRAMTEDVRKNNHMWVFSTREGFGSSDFDPADNPLLAETEFEISGQKALANDLFRVVHDYFGHVKEGVGFRAAGEENAWRAHMAMFSPLAGRALTTETRGQNSWVNYGPFAEFNKTASGADTKYADQKIGLLPEWASTEGRSDEEYNQSERLPTTIKVDGKDRPTSDSEGKSISATEEGVRNFWQWFGDSKIVDGQGRPKVMYHGTHSDFSTFKVNEALGGAVFLAPKAAYAKNFAYAKGANILPVYAKVLNPRKGVVLAYNESKILASVRARGQDGAYVRDSMSEENNLAVFESSQIKSAVGNNGEFNPKDSNILHQSNFYSALEKEIRGLSKIANKNGEVSVEQAKAWINSRQKEGKFKQAEVEAVGLLDWLDTLEGKVPVADVEEFVQENGVQVEEVVLEGEGEGEPDVGQVYDEAYQNFIDSYDGLSDEVFDDAIADVAGDMMSDHNDGRWGDLIGLNDEEEVETWLKDEGIRSKRDLVYLFKSRYGPEDVLGSEGYNDIRNAQEQDDWESNQDYYIDQARERLENESGGGSGGTEFEDYVLRGGGSEYKELLLTLPNAKARFDAPHFDKAQENGAENIFAHTRINERYVEAPMTDEELAQKAAYDEWVKGNHAPEIEELMDERREAARDYRLAMEDWQKSMVEDTSISDAEYNKRIGGVGSNPPEVLKPFLKRMDEVGARVKAKQEERSALKPKEPTRSGEKERVLFVEEIQSDWAQKGRDEGFAKPRWTAAEERRVRELEEPRPYPGLTEAEQAEFQTLLVKRAEVGTPTAPFVTDTKAWTGLVAKRLLRYAAENGFDRIAWTAGAQQAERYRLSKFVDKVTAKRSDDGKYYVKAVTEDGKPVAADFYEADKLAGTFGKELADKIVKQPDGEQTYEGLDLDVGGSGMKEFYDRIVPSVFNDISRKLGGDKVETISMGSQSGKIIKGLDGKILIAYPNGSYLKNRNTGVMTDSQDRADRFDSKEEATKFLDKFESQNLHDVGRQMSLAITPALKEKVMQGLPLFQRDRAGYNPNTFTISLMEGSDMTSVIHEGGHFYLEALADMASHPGAPEQVVKDFDTTLDWFGVTKDDWKTMTLEQKRPHHEQWAQSYELYAMEGVAPTEEMQPVFERFKEWMLETYKSLKEFLKNNPLAGRLNNDVRQVFDRLLASESDIAATAAARGSLKQSGKQEAPTTPAGKSSTKQTPPTSAVPPAAAPAKPFNPNEDIPETKFRKAQRLSQDSFNRFTVIKEWLAKHGTVLSEKADVFQAEERYNSLVANQLEDFREQQRNPLIEKITKAGFTLSDVADFLEAQHAREANKAIRDVRGDPTATAYGIEDADAAAYLAKADPKLKKLANELRDITEQSKQMRLDAGLLSQDEVDAWENAYNHYIPVKGDADAKGGTGKGLKVNFKSKRRLGHGKRDEAVIENIFLDHERAIMQVEKNRVAKHLVMMAAEMNRPEIVSIGQPVKRNTLRSKTAYEVQVSGVTRSVFSTKQAADMFKQLLPTIDPTVQPNTVSINPTTDQRVIAMASPMLAENEINAYIDGHAIRVQINDDLLARAYGKLGVTGFSALVSAGRAFNGYLSKVYTGYNPEFIITNMIRDFTSGLINLTGEEGGKIAAKAAGNYVKSFSSLMKYAISNGKKSDKWIDMYRSNGGNTGAAYLSDLERLGDEIKTEYASYQGVLANLKSGDIANASRAAGRKVFNVTLKWIYNLNQAGENAMRLAAFKAMIQSGKTPNQAAKASKNITVNFNRKGEYGAEANAAYLFFNASVQGTAALAHAHFKGKHKAQAWGLSSMMGALGYLAALALIGDDEDDYDKINDYTKSRNLLIKAGEGYAQIPVPYGYGFFWNTGRAIAEAQHKGELGVLPWHMAASAIEELTPFSDTVVGTQDGFQFDQVLLGMLPTVIKIPAQPAFNKQLFSGGELFPERASQQFQPDREKLWRSTQGTMYDKMAGWLSDANVGDVTPETLKHYTRTFTGGTGALVDATISAAMLKKDGAELEPSEIPFVRKAYSKLTIRENRAAYYKAREEAKKTAEAFSRAKTRNDVTTIDKLVRDEGEMLGLDAYANSLSEAIGAVRDLQDAIRVDDNLNAAEKRVQIKELEITEQKFYDQYLDVFKIEKMNMKSRKD